MTAAKSRQPLNFTLGVMIRILVAPFILCFSGVVMPCMVPPTRLFRNHAWISKWGVIDSNCRSNFKFRHTRKRLSISCGSHTERQRSRADSCSLPFTWRWRLDDTFFRAFWTSFWQQRSGDLGIRSDCTLIPPAFEIGRYYLVLHGGTPDSKDFEELAGPFDQWLVFVKKQISRGK